MEKLEFLKSLHSKEVAKGMIDIIQGTGEDLKQSLLDIIYKDVTYYIDRIYTKPNSKIIINFIIINKNFDDNTLGKILFYVKDNNTLCDYILSKFSKSLDIEKYFDWDDILFEKIVNKWYPNEKIEFHFVRNINYTELYNMSDFTQLIERLNKISKIARKLFFSRLICVDKHGNLLGNTMPHFMNGYKDEIIEFMNS